MKMEMVRVLGVAVVAGCVMVSGCQPTQPSGKPGIGERSGAAVDNAAEKTAEATKAAAVKAKEVTGKALENAGESMERTGENMQ